MSWELLVNEKLNQGYEGKAEECSYTFTVNLPEQIGSAILAQHSLAAHIEELRKEGSVVLEYRLWEDKMSGTWSTDYQAEVVASSSPLFWAVIIVGVMVILGLLVTNQVIKNVQETVRYLAEEGKALIPPITVGMLALAIFGLVILTRRRA